jgi:hypothetical protein
MIPQPSRALADLAGKLVNDIAPETSSTFAAANSGMIAMLLGALAQDAERAAANRMADIDDIQRLFTRLTPDCDPARAAERTHYVERQPKSLRLTDLDALHADGMSLLISLHGWAEANDPELDRSIWGLLLNHTERNRLDV